MKRTLFVTSIIALFSLGASAQDDLYNLSSHKDEKPKTEKKSKIAQEQIPSNLSYKYKPTHNTIRVSYGLGKITSDVYVNDLKDVRHPALYGWQFDYEHLFGGEDGQHGFRITATSGDTNKDTNISLSHIGAAYVYNYTTTLGWVWSMSAGMGVSYASGAYTDGDNSGFGAVVSVGCDYKTHRNFSFGAELRYRSDRFSKPEGYQLKDDEFYGFKHISLLIGPRFYF